MKNISLISVFLILFGLFLTSCSNENPPLVSDVPVASCSDGVQNGYETGIDCGWTCSNSCFEVNGLEGDIVSKVILDNSNDYKLVGPLIVRDGGILEIREGTIIKATPGKNAYIAVAQGGKIFVYGKADNPVVITSDADVPMPGDWGGLVICGKAPVNTGTPSRSATADIFYGGDDPLDSSGVLQYLRIEYTGATFSNSAIFSGVSFYGVGSYTAIEHVQSFNTLGDGIAFYGGTANSKWLITTKSVKNGFFMTDGWQGVGTLWFVSGTTESGIKMANNNLDVAASPMTSGEISEVSILGPVTEGALNYSDGGGDFTLSTIYTAGIDLGIKVGANAITSVDEGRLIITPIQFDNVVPGFEITNYMGANPQFYFEGNTVGAGSSEAIPDWALDWTTGL